MERVPKVGDKMQDKDGQNYEITGLNSKGAVQWKSIVGTRVSKGNWAKTKFPLMIKEGRIKYLD